ncbi:MAG: RIP metalloprotease RseP [Gemmatimonadaceae bacterium]
MLELLRTIAAIALVFGLVIFIHELGHFLAAKAFGVYAPRFSIGFGPALWSRKWGETEYIIAVVPLGGYVRMASRDDETMAFIEGGGEHPAAQPDEQPEVRASRWYDPNALAPFGPRPVPEHRWFESKPLPARLVILFAGVTMNIVLGFVVLAALSWSVGNQIIRTRVIGDVLPLAGAPALQQELAIGDTIVAVNGRPVHSWNEVIARIDSTQGNRLVLQTQRRQVAIRIGGASGATREQVENAVRPYLPPIIDGVLTDNPADRAGLRAGDSIVAVGGSPVNSWSQIVDRIEASPGKPLAFAVMRAGTPVRMTVTPDSVPQEDETTGRTGIVGKIGAMGRAPTEREPISATQAVSFGWRETWAMTGAIVVAVRKIATGALSVKQLNGPIGIGRAASTAVQRGWADVFYLLALLSVNLAVFNLLPIPILDGGQIALNVVEAAKGSAVSMRTRENLIRFGLAAIALLFVIVMYNDITSWVRHLLGP